MERNLETSSLAVRQEPQPSPWEASRPLPDQATFLVVVRKRWMTVMFTVSIFALGAGGFLAHATPQYTSTSRMLVEQNAPRILSDNPAGQPAEYDSYLFTQSEMINSFPIIAVALEDPSLKTARYLQGVRDPIDYLRKNLLVDVGKRDEIITVSFDAPDPGEAAATVNAVVNAYLSYESRTKHGAVGEMLKVLTADKDRRYAELAKQQQTLLEFKQANGDAFLQTDKGSIVTSDLATISGVLMHAKIEASEKEADLSVSNNLTIARLEAKRAEQRVRHLQEIYDRAERRAVDMNAKGVKFMLLQTEIDRTNRMLDILDARIKELSVTGDSGTLNISVLEPARPAEKPSKPNRLQTMAAIVAVGLLLGCGMALIREHLDQKIRSAEEVTCSLGLPVLGVVPSFKRRKPGNDSAYGPDVQVNPNSAVAEAYRGLQISLHFRPSSHPIRTILITSPSPGDGKTTTCSNLAVTLARAGRRTLLIDADMRRPAQHLVFGVDGELGLADVLARNAAIGHCIVPTEIDGLDLLPCGSVPANPAELLNSNEFEQLLAGLSEQYDQVILDSPPVMPVADSRILGAHCDATILVVRADRSSKKTIRLACDLLDAVNAQVIGVLVNDLARTSDSRKYHDRQARAPEKSWTKTTEIIRRQPCGHGVPVGHPPDADPTGNKGGRYARLAAGEQNL